ncbi:hypothetical protein ES703_104022 [subsurface metagenome]
MRIHSTGLGSTELVCRVSDLTVKHGYLLLSLRSTEPVRWRIRILIERRDVIQLILRVLKGPLFLWLLAIFKKPQAPPTDY